MTCRWVRQEGAGIACRAAATSVALNAPQSGQSEKKRGSLHRELVGVLLLEKRHHSKPH